MRPLYIAFCGEGKDDSRVIPILIQRAISDLPLRQPVDLSITTWKWDTRSTFENALRETVRQAVPRHHLLVAHVDADARDEKRIIERKVLPAIEKLKGTTSLNMPVVWAIPVQSLEAWLLCSAEAFEQSLLSRSSHTSQLSLPSAPEKLSPSEAKRVLRASVETLLAKTRRHRSRIDVERYQTDIAENLSLDALRRLDSFQRFESGLRVELANLNYLE